jgi:protoporphyrinogen oxidase
MATKVWGNPSELDPSFAKLRFSVPTIVQWTKKLIGHTGNFNDKVFYYPKNGFQEMWDRIGEHLTKNGVKILLNAEVTELQVSGNRAQKITIKQKGEISAYPTEWVVSTIPTSSFLKVMSPKASLDLQSYSFSMKNKGMLLACFLVKKEKSLPARVVILPEGKYCFNRLSEQNQFSRFTVPKGYSVVTADVLTELNSPLWKKNEKDLLGEIQKQIEDCGFFGANEVAQSEICRIDTAYPIPTKEREEAQERFNEHMGQFENILCTGRFASSDYNNSHTALKKGLMAADFIVKENELKDWYLAAEGIRKTAIRD